MLRSLRPWVALALVILTVSLPVQAAASIAQVRVTNSDGVVGILNPSKQGESLTVTADVLSDHAVEASDVRIVSGGIPILMQSCVPQGSNTYVCTYTQDSVSGISSSFTLTVQVYEDDAVAGSGSTYVTLDSGAPSAALSVAGGNLNVGAGELTLTITADDAVCSRISSIEVREGGADGDIIATQVEGVDFADVNCHAVSTVSFIASDRWGQTQGDHRICAFARDIVGNVGMPGCITLQYDALAPVISAVRLLSGGQPISYLGTGTQAVLEVDTDATLVDADIFDLDGQTRNAHLTCAAGTACAVEGESPCSAYLQTCTVPVTLALPDGDTLSGTVRVTARDEAGNTASRDEAISLAVDTTAPTGVLRSDFTSGDVHYVNGVHNLLILDATDDGSGLASATLQATQLGFGSIVGECSSERCEWSGLPTAVSHGATATLVVSDIRDASGNHAPGPSLDVIVDRSPPRIPLGEEGLPDVTFTCRSSQGLSRDYCLVGDTLEVEAHIVDNAGVRDAWVDLSKLLGPGAEHALMTCSKEDADAFTTCRYESGGQIIENDAEYVDFQARDLANNTLDAPDAHRYGRVPFQSYTLADESASPWQAVQKARVPYTMDREILSLMPLTQYHEVQIVGPNVLSSTFIGCDGFTVDAPADGDSGSAGGASADAAGGTDASDNAFGASRSVAEAFGYPVDAPFDSTTIGAPTDYLVGTTAEIYDKTKAVVRLDFDVGEYTVDDLAYSCTFHVVGVSNGEVQEQDVVVWLGVQFFNSALGMPDAALNKQIEAIKNGWMNNDIFKTLLKLNNLFGSICKLILTFNNLRVGIEGIATSLDVIADSVGFLKGVADAFHKVADGMGTAGTNIYNTMGKFCKFVNCEPGGGLFTMGEAETDIGGNEVEAAAVAAAGPEDTRRGYSTERSYRGYEAELARAYGGLFDEDTNLGAGLDPWSVMNPKDNLVTAAMVGCIPGILYNLDKLRQIDCQYVQCLQQSASDNVPMYVCSEQKGYQACTFVYGQLFNAIPFTALLSRFSETVQNLISNPAKLMGLMFSYSCSQETQACTAGLCSLRIPCAIVRLWDLLPQVMHDFNTIINPDEWKVNNDICAQVPGMDSSNLLG